MNLGELIHSYCSDAQSPFAALEYASARNYRRQCERLARDHGNVPLAQINARLLKQWHAGWSAVGTPTAHGLITMLRVVAGYGATLWENEAGNAECQRIRAILHTMRFPMGARRTEIISYDQAKAIVSHAKEKGLASISLCQAFQFESLLRQKDCVGAWVPCEFNPASPEVRRRVGGRHWRWVKGLRWEEIDNNMILRHVTSKKRKLLTVDLNTLPLVMECLRTNIRALHPATGPVIICEATGLPWGDREYRAAWRRIARECGIPDSVQNRDSRAGGITEGLAAGAAMDDARKAATHSQLSTTAQYSRAEQEAHARVMAARVAARR